jgi:hypothetical protein
MLRGIDDDDPHSPRTLIDAERRVHRILRKRFAEALAELAVSFAQFEVMELLHDEEKLHPGAIGRLPALTPTFECLDALDDNTRTTLVRDLRACEAVLPPRPTPWWL